MVEEIQENNGSTCFERRKTEILKVSTEIVSPGTSECCMTAARKTSRGEKCPQGQPNARFPM